MIKDQGQGGMYPAEARQNADMFNEIAGSYDFLNHILSFNVDRYWRRQAIRSLADIRPERILDVATGTADLAVAAMKLPAAMVTGVDISTGMLEIGREKVARLGFSSRISLLEAASEALPFAGQEFDAAMVAFGVRNFDNPEMGLGEIYRVLRPGGKLVVLEFTLPDKKWLRALYRVYFHRIVPAIGRWFSRDLSAYRYLPESVELFPKGKAFLDLLQRSGFRHASFKPLSFGICGLYVASKKNEINTNLPDS